jgi:hypothetical protein
LKSCIDQFVQEDSASEIGPARIEFVCGLRKENRLEVRQWVTSRCYRNKALARQREFGLLKAEARRRVALMNTLLKRLLSNPCSGVSGVA